MMFDFDALLLDIEGTTTPITFVHDVLFPHARAHARAWLETHWDSVEAQSDVASLRAQAAEDLAQGLDTPQIPEQGDRTELIDATMSVVHAFMDDDRKVTGLKSLQGRIWFDGYASGQLEASLFDDVAPTLRRLQAQQVPIHIYSSGSIAAQKLLFAHTVAGDLTPLLSGYFDTTTGPKKEAASYRRIAAEVAVEPARLLFLTDVVAEADAASEAGVQAAILNRPGNHPQPPHSHPVLEDFAPLLAG